MILIASVIILAALAHVGLALYLAGGIHDRYERTSDYPTVTIIVPVRNEESNMRNLLDSLLKVDYPQEKMQVVIVNDLSRDGTREIALEYVGKFGCAYHVVDVPENADRNLKGKIRPLSIGMDIATGEIILMTDADCTILPGWVKSTTAFFTDDVGMVCGTTLPSFKQSRTPVLTAFETVDWALLLGVCSAMSGRGNTQALIGNNFSIRRITYDEAGTFRALTDNFIEDLSLMQAVKANGKWKVIFPADPGLLLVTRPLNSIREVIAQRFRWVIGAKWIEKQGAALLWFAIFTHVTWPLWFIFFPSVFWPAYLFVVIGDASVVLPMLRRYSHPALIALMPFYPVYGLFYAMSFLMMKLLKRKILWKEREF